jgi:hypothetical protein
MIPYYSSVEKPEVSKVHMQAWSYSSTVLDCMEVSG